MTIRDLQQSIERIYGEKDKARGLEKNFLWFVEEVGELSEALLMKETQRLPEEFADVLAWLATLASLTGVDLEAAAQRYASFCPRCRKDCCCCPEPGEP